MSGVAVAQVILDQPEIVAPIRQGEAARVPQHVWMDRRQSGTPCRRRDQVVDRLTGECLATLRYEQPGESVQTGGQIALDRAEFITRDRLFDSQPVLEATNPKGGPPRKDSGRCRVNSTSTRTLWSVRYIRHLSERQRYRSTVHTSSYLLV